MTSQAGQATVAAGVGVSLGTRGVRGAETAGAGGTPPAAARAGGGGGCEGGVGGGGGLVVTRGDQRLGARAREGPTDGEGYGAGSGNGWGEKGLVLIEIVRG